MTQIPFIRLDRQFKDLKKETINGIEQVLSSGKVLQGPQTKILENSISKITNNKFCISVGSGTDALNLSLLSLNLPKGSKVAVPAMSFISSASIILHNNLIPVFLDVSPETMLTDENYIYELLDKKKIDAIIAVHLYGQIQPLEEITKVTNLDNIPIIEDAAQSLGSLRFNKPIGSQGKITCISFDPTKVIGAYGSGGAVLTDDKEISKNIELLRYHGHIGNSEYPKPGFNSQISEIQALILNTKLRYLNKWQQKRNYVAKIFLNELKDINQINTLKVLNGNIHNFHKFVICCEDRDKLQEYLADKGIGTKIHYAIPLHQQKQFSKFAKNLSLPVVEQFSKKVLSLPIYPELEDNEINYTIENIKNFYRLRY